eukprot:896923_1
MANTFDPEEVEILLSTGTKGDKTSDEIFVAKNGPKTSEETKYGPKTMYGIIMIGIGTMMYGLIGTLVRLSMLGEEAVAYNSNAALVVSEVGKFVVTFLLLFYSQGIQQAICSLKNVPFKEWFLFSIPALIYSVTNNLGFYILQYMDPGSLGVLQQTKIITTALLWWCAFTKSIDKQQWVSLVLLCLGSMLVAWPDDTKDKEQEMYVQWPMGPLLVAVRVSLSAVAGIYTEFVYKKFGSERSLHVDNLSMYFWGSLANMAQYYYADDEGVGLLYGFNIWTYLLCANYLVLGISVAYVMKYFTNIIKLLMSGLAMVVSGVLAFLMFELTWTLTYCLGLIVVITAVFLYKSPTKCIK